FRGFSWFAFAGGAIRRGGEPLIAAAAAAAVGDRYLLARFGQIAEDMAAVAVFDDRSRRHVDDEVVGVAAVTVTAAAGAAVRRPPVLAMDERREVIGPRDGADDHRPAVAAVAAVGPAFR